MSDLKTFGRKKEVTPVESNAAKLKVAPGLISCTRINCGELAFQLFFVGKSPEVDISVLAALAPFKLLSSSRLYHSIDILLNEPVARSGTI